MISWEKIIRNKPFQYFSVGTVLVIFAIILQNYFSRQLDQKKVRENFLCVLQDKEKLLSDYLQNLKNNYYRLPDSLKTSFFSDYRKLYDYENISFFILENDSLVFWSTNLIPFQDEIKTIKSSSYEIIKLKNGWYNILHERDSSKTFIGLILLQHQYSFENDFLKNDFPDEFRVPAGTVITPCSPGTGLHIAERDLLIDLKFPDKLSLNDLHIFLLFLIFFVALLFLLVSIYLVYKELSYFTNRKWLLLLGFATDVVLIRLFTFYFRIPSSVYDSKLFGPEYFSSSNFLPSLGDFLVNSILLLMISYLFFLHFPYSLNLKSKIFRYKIFRLLFILFIISGGILICNAVIRELVMNSTIPLTLQNISALTINSILGFFIIAAVSLSFLFVLFRLTGIYTIRNFGIALILMAILTTISLNHFNSQKEKEKRKILAVRLSIEGDPFVEMLFANIENDLVTDPVLNGKSNGEEEVNDDSLASYIIRKYFQESLNNYIVQITVCRPGKSLRIQPQNYFVDCNDFFQDILRDFGKPTSASHLRYIDYGDGTRNYLAVIPFTNNVNHSNSPSVLYIEINSKLVFKDLGYPELLTDKRQSNVPDVTGYSYAFFRNGKLINRFGSIQYSMFLDHTIAGHLNHEHFYSKNGTDHFCYPISKDSFLIISKKANTILDEIAPFSYLVFLFIIFVLIFFLIVKFSAFLKISQLRLSDRLEISMTGILIISLLVVGYLAIFYIIRLNRDKNHENLSERAHSIWIEMQHKVGFSENLDNIRKTELNELLTKFSNVFFSDINLYSPEGRLIATSRPEIFEKGLISTLMDNIAYANLKFSHSTLFIHDEVIGSHNYSSAYLPFYNDRNVLLAYLNLPYFARQDDLKREISTFLMAFINIYVFLIIIGFFVGLIVSNYITRPLRLLTVKLGKLTFGKSNDKLDWSRNDEVGKLVEEYNRKVDELAKSAEMLAQSERESAWREMARQIAHEIKNPLTPMKLSVQYLQKSWKEKPSDWDQRIKRFTATMIEQIESLSFIASEFSDFARMPDTKKERLELNEIIRNAIDLYENIANIRISLESDNSEAYMIADRKQLLRVFTNLFNNSVEAIGEVKEGWIRINIKTMNDRHVVTITDNGSGIPENQTAKIFQPNFTTKSGGMGLGLAIVKNIIIASGGEISFQSKPSYETVFTLSFPDIQSM